MKINDDARSNRVTLAGKAASVAAMTTLFSTVRDDKSLPDDKERIGATISGMAMMFDSMVEAATEDASYGLQRELLIKLFENVLSKSISALYQARANFDA